MPKPMAFLSEWGWFIILTAGLAFYCWVLPVLIMACSWCYECTKTRRIVETQATLRPQDQSYHGSDGSDDENDVEADDHPQLTDQSGQADQDIPVVIDVRRLDSDIQQWSSETGEEWKNAMETGVGPSEAQMVGTSFEGSITAPPPSSSGNRNSSLRQSHRGNRNRRRWSDSFNNANSRASRLSGTAAASSNASTALPAAELIPVCVVMPNNPRAVREQRIPSAPWVDPEEREQTRDE